MSISDRFDQVRARRDDRSADALPTTLVECCRDLFGLDGAGISLTSELRIPLAATSEDAVTAEVLQTTLGEGPCLTAAARGTPLVADASSMAAAWPVFGSALTRRHPVPLGRLRPVAHRRRLPVRGHGSVLGRTGRRDPGRGDRGRRAGRAADGGLFGGRGRCRRSPRRGLGVDAVAVGE